MKKGSRYVHGMSKTPTHNTWWKMHERCYDKNCKEYYRYGGRGILMSDEWRTDFLAFLRDMGEKPGPDFSIDRIDNEKGYSANNCRWATRKEQARNRRSNVVLEYKGEKMTLVEWSEKTGITQAALEHRVKRGWSVERTLTQPLRDLGSASVKPKGAGSFRK